MAASIGRSDSLQFIQSTPSTAAHSSCRPGVRDTTADRALARHSRVIPAKAYTALLIFSSSCIYGRETTHHLATYIYIACYVSLTPPPWISCGSARVSSYPFLFIPREYLDQIDGNVTMYSHVIARTYWVFLSISPMLPTSTSCLVELFSSHISWDNCICQTIENCAFCKSIFEYKHHRDW